LDLRDYIRLLRRGWPVVVALILAGTAAGVGLTLATTKVYQADVQVFVGTSSTASAADLNQGNTFTQDRVQSYTSIATSPKVTTPVIEQLHLSLTDAQLAAKISADAPLNKTLVNLHVTDNDPRTSAKLANAVGDQFDKVVQQVEARNADGTSVVVLTTIHPATTPTSPIKPSPIINIGLGLVLGLLVGVGIIVLRDVLDNTIKGPSDFTELDVPVLGTVPFDKRAAQAPISFRKDPHSLRSEAYRQLRTNLQFVNIDKTPRVIAVTSAIPGEGKSTTAMNLAAALAEAGHRVVLIEADLRRPTIAKTLGLVSEVGLTTVLIGQTTLDDALQNAGRNLAVLTSGPVPPNPSELLTSAHARTLIATIAERADFTIIDTAPLLPVADAAEIATIAEATLIVHRPGKTTREQALRSIGALEKVGERPVGVVLNMVTKGSGRYDYEQNYYYSYRPDRARRGHRAKPEAARDQALTEVPLRHAEPGPTPLAPSPNGTTLVR
jgi:capsular exopolysaccharide synthesis family protein